MKFFEKKSLKLSHIKKKDKGIYKCIPNNKKEEYVKTIPSMLAGNKNETNGCNFAVVGGGANFANRYNWIVAYGNVNRSNEAD